jgi:hypothetical protein
MQQDHDLLDALRTNLAELTALHAASGAEQAVIARQKLRHSVYAWVIQWWLSPSCEIWQERA